MNRGTTFYYNVVTSCFVFADKNDLDKAINNYNEEIKIYQEYQDLIKEGQGQVLSDLARAFMKRGTAFDAKNDLDEAINNYTQAIKIYHRLIKEGNSEKLSDLARAFIKRGNVFRDKSDLDMAIFNWKIARDIYQGLVGIGQFYYKSYIENIDKLLRECKKSRKN